ncbi:Gfo/Idh/MocA family oxidoreductase [Bacillus sp. SJS]|uniref:Gfo/Idh/MocA family oxidoreductase n=1 Tax=Bacillus sp. SJS TaxID=1423321 RepID=UPI0004DD752D|nr:Gfo/Idh/MocA family oxidoreductase [Bacillus sp. SJS]KZZ85230.1 oxidoreductase [Bacillus sp. SJS]
MEKIRSGLVGYGLSGQVFHAPFLHVNPRFDLSMVMERSKNLAKKNYPYTERVTSYEEIIEDDSIELVIITTPNKHHYEMVELALLKGKHVLVEKPFTISSSEGYKLSRLAKEQKKVLAVYHNRRWDGDFLTVRALLQQGMLGKPAAYEAHFDRFEKNVSSGAWREKDHPGSGIVYDLGSHLIDQALSLFGVPIEISADIDIQRKGGAADDAFAIRLYYPELTAVLKSGMLVREPGPRFQVHGSNGSYVKYGIDPQEERLGAGMMPDDDGIGIEEEEMWGILNTDINGLHYKGKIETLPGQYMSFYDGLYRSIREGEAAPVQAEDAADVIKIIECAKISAAAKRTVSFSEQQAAE